MRDHTALAVFGSLVMCAVLAMFGGVGYAVDRLERACLYEKRIELNGHMFTCTVEQTP